MIMRKITDLIDGMKNLLFQYRMIVTGAVLLIVLIAVLILNFKNEQSALFFYPDGEGALFSERRVFKSRFGNFNNIENLINELLLGSMKKKISFIIPLKSKLISLYRTGDTLHLNFNRELLMNLDSEYSKDTVLYSVIMSITDTAVLYDRSIKRVKFYFEGKEYRTVGDIAVPPEGFAPDWKILLK